MKYILPLAKYALFLAGYTLVVYGIGIAVQSFTTGPIISPLFPKIVLVLFVVTFFSHIISMIGIKGQPEVGVFGILGAIVLKMILSLSFFLVLIYRFPEEKSIALGLNFFCVYLLMTGFELTVLLCNLRRKIN